MLDENLANFADAEEQMWYKNGKRANMSNNIEFELNFEIFEIILPLFGRFLCIFILSAYAWGGRFARLSLYFEDLSSNMLKYPDFHASLNVVMIQQSETFPPPKKCGR